MRADDVDELLDVGDVMTVPTARGARVAVVTTSGGSGILAADAVEAQGLEMATLAPETLRVLDEIVPAFGSTANPVDVTASVMSNASLFDRTLDVIADDPGVDLIVACFCVLTGKDVDDVVASLAAWPSGPACRSSRSARVRTTWHRSRREDARGGIPCYPTPARAVRAAAALVQFSAERPAPRPPYRRNRHPGGARRGRERAGDEGAAGGRWHPRAGWPCSHLGTGRARRRGAGRGRAVFKAVVPDLLHKSDAGGVIVGVTAEDAAAAWEKVSSLGGEVLVEELVPGGSRRSWG